MAGGARRPAGPLSRAIAVILSVERERLGISQEQLGASVGVSQTQMGDYLNGVKSLLLEELDALCDVLELDILVVIEEADRNR